MSAVSFASFSGIVGCNFSLGVAFLSDRLKEPGETLRCHPSNVCRCRYCCRDRRGGRRGGSAGVATAAVVDAAVGAGTVGAAVDPTGACVMKVALTTGLSASCRSASLIFPPLEGGCGDGRRQGMLREEEGTLEVALTTEL